MDAFAAINTEQYKHGRRSSAVRKTKIQRSRVVFLSSPSSLRFLPPRTARHLAAAAASSRRDAQDGAGLVHRRHGRLTRRCGRVAAVPSRRLELLRRHPLRRLLLLPAPLRHRGRRPLRQRHRLRHLQLGDQGSAGAAGELPERDQQLPLGEGAHVLRPLPRHRHLLRLHRLCALPPRHGAHAAEVRHLLHARMRAHHRLALRAQGASQPARPHDLQGEATVLGGICWMHGRYNLCFYGASQLFPLCDLFSPSGSGPCILYHILLPRRIKWIEIHLVWPFVFSVKLFWSMMLVCYIYLFLYVDADHPLDRDFMTPTPLSSRLFLSRLGWVLDI